MFSKHKPAAGLSFVGPDLVVSGDIATTHMLHIDGRIDGHVQCDQLTQGPGGTVTGNITADEARVAGLVEGAVIARSVILESTARVKGDITYQTISIAAGAQIDGRLARRESLEGTPEESPMLVATPIAEPPPARSPKPADPDDIFSLTPPPQPTAG